jgi:hypothetical protein
VEPDASSNRALEELRITKVTAVEEEIMVRTLIAAATVTGSLALGAVGLVGAAGPAGASSPTTATTPTTATPATHASRCARAEKLAARITARETKLSARLPKLEAREAKATAAGHTTLAADIGKAITWVHTVQSHGTTVLNEISAKCGSATSAS